MTDYDSTLSLYSTCLLRATAYLSFQHGCDIYSLETDGLIKQNPNTDTGELVWFTDDGLYAQTAEDAKPSDSTFDAFSNKRHSLLTLKQLLDR